MYAIRLMTEIYHLVEPSGQHTLCGLRISRIISARKTNTLQLVNDVESNVRVCKHCQRIKGQESSGQIKKPSTNYTESVDGCCEALT